MSRSLAVKFTPARGGYSVSNIHLFRNFAEELSLRLGVLGQLPMDQVDIATSVVTIIEIRSRKFARCRVLVRDLITIHLMVDEISLDEDFQDV